MLIFVLMKQVIFTGTNYDEVKALPSGKVAVDDDGTISIRSL